jgi:hypothetical protein
MPFAGGIAQYGYQCGMLWGATLAAGAQAYRLYGAGPQAETQAIIAAQRLVESFALSRTKSIASNSLVWTSHRRQWTWSCISSSKAEPYAAFTWSRNMLQ